MDYIASHRTVILIVGWVTAPRFACASVSEPEPAARHALYAPRRSVSTTPPLLVAAPYQDEYLSSQRCCQCKSDKPLVAVSAREKKCNSPTCQGRVVNRDDNASSNLQHVFEVWVADGSRPGYLSRRPAAAPAAAGAPVGTSGR